MSFSDIAITLFVLFAIFLLAYIRMTGKSLLEVFNEIREALSTQTEEVGNPLTRYE